MNKKSGLYTIQNLTTVKGQGQNHYGPTIILDGEVVKAIVENEIRRDEGAALVSMLRENLISSLGKGFENTIRLNFFMDSWLLTGMTLEGMNCACFHVNGDTMSEIESGVYKNIRYDPHNIDNSHHGAVIVSTWLLWFNTIIASTDFEQPFRM